MTLAPRDLATFSMLISVENDPVLGENIDNFVLNFDDETISEVPLIMEFLYPTEDIPVWGK